MPDARTPTRSLPVSKLLIPGRPVDPMGGEARTHRRSYLQGMAVWTQLPAGT